MTGHRMVSSRIRWAVFLPAVALVAALGCGSGDSDPGTGVDALGMLEPGVEALGSRLESHYETVTGILGSPAAPSIATEGFATAADTYGEGGAAQDEDWKAIERERDDYGEHMYRILDDLGETVTEIEGCGMMVGGMMFGEQYAGQACSCQPFMESSSEEIQLHLREMERWMEDRDAQGLLQEMQRHREQMGTRIQEMGAHMREQYGSRDRGGMMGGGGGMMH